MKEFDVCRKVPEDNFINITDIITHPKNHVKKFTMYYCKHNTGMVLDGLASMYGYARTYYIADYPFNNYESKPGTIDISSDAMQIIAYVNRCVVRSIDIYNRAKLENDEMEDQQ